MNLELIRFAYLPNATLGYLYVPDHDGSRVRFCTLEEPWKPDPDGPGGQRRAPGLNESCVQDGPYALMPHSGEKWKEVWCLFNPVLGIYQRAGDIPNGQPWGRSEILIHSGNDTDDIMGCIAVGKDFGFPAGRPFVSNSREALNYLRARLGQFQHGLTIRPCQGTAETL